MLTSQKTLFKFSYSYYVVPYMCLLQCHVDVCGDSNYESFEISAHDGLLSCIKGISNLFGKSDWMFGDHITSELSELLEVIVQGLVDTTSLGRWLHHSPSGPL